MVKMPRTFQNHQSNAGCSNFFNLKPNAGTNEQKILQYQQAKIEKIFGCQAYSTANTSRLAALNRSKNKKGVQKCNQSIPFLKMRNLPSALEAWLLRTRNAGGVCSSVAYVISRGSLILIFMVLFIRRTLYEYFKEIFVNEYICLNNKLCCFKSFHKPSTFMLGFPTYIFRIDILQKS